MYAKYDNYRNLHKRLHNRHTTSKQQNISDNVTVAGTEFMCPGSNSASSKTSRSHDSLQLSQETLDGHTRSQSRFNEQMYLRLQALEAAMDKMPHCIKEVHQRSQVSEQIFRETVEWFRDAAMSAIKDGQSSDVPSERSQRSISTRSWHACLPARSIRFFKES